MMKKQFLIGAAIVMVGSAPAVAQFQSAMDTTKRTQAEARASQQRIDKLDAEASKLLVDYRAALKDLELLTRFNESQRVEIKSQTAQIEALTADIENVGKIQKAMQPLMKDMLNALEQFVKADLPFRLKERQGRVERLRSIMNDSSVSEAQRYRLIVEAYQIENEYGRVLETYEDKITTPDGEELLVEFLQIGRLALVYKNKDNSILKIFDREQGDFVDLPKKYLGDITYGFRMAKKQTPPDLLPVPITGPVDLTEKSQ